MEGDLVRRCITAATESSAAVEKWRRQRRTLERMPSQLAESLLRNLLTRRLLIPSLLEIFKYSVEEIDLGGESVVDAEWMAYLSGFRYLRSLNLSDCYRINNSALWDVTGMTILKELNLSRCSKITNSGIKHLLSIPTLEKLWISQTGVTADGIRTLAALTNLILLDLGGLPVTDSALNSLQALTKLQHLDLWGSEITNEGAILLKMFPCLKNLNLAWTKVTDLPTLSSLSYLNLSNCTINHLFEDEGQKPHLEKLFLSGATFNALQPFQYVETSRLSFLDLSRSSLQLFSFLRHMFLLNHLNLSDTSLGDNDIECVAHVGANLIYLNISNTKVTSDGLGVLAGHVSKLETVLLSGTAIDDAAISYISMMPSLKVIDLHNTNIKGLIRQPDEVPEAIMLFSLLENHFQIEKLDLEGTHVDDVSLSPLSSFSKLKYLYLRNFSLTDETLHHASSIPNLVHLGIRDGILSNVGINSFIVPPKLEVFDLRGCWLITRDALVTFCQKHPHIELRHELGEIKDMHCPSPPVNKQKLSQMTTSRLTLDEVFLDQRIKYSREELMALKFSSVASTSDNQGNNQLLPDI